MRNLRRTPIQIRLAARIVLVSAFALLVFSLWLFFGVLALVLLGCMFACLCARLHVICRCCCMLDRGAKKKKMDPVGPILADRVR